MDILELAYSQGHQAYYNGYGLISNPYKRYTKEWQEWRTGWNDEKSDDPYWDKIGIIKNKTYGINNTGLDERPSRSL